jgi:NAD(P)-dependent dehydrogenase (short-subunit alcohol dehydrogenase family)
VLARAFLPYKQPGSTIVAYSSGFAILPPSFPMLSKSSAYTVSKMGTARFYEFLAVENPDLNVFIIQPGVIRTALYDKGKLQLDDTIDTSKLELLSGAYCSKLTVSQFNCRPISQCGWQAPRLSHSLDASCLPTGTWSN